MRWHPIAVAAVVGAAVATVVACGTDPVGVDACRKIEHARCENAYSCGIDLSTPTHRGDSPELATAACNRYYDDACLHGLSAADPGAVQVQACVDAINTGDCSVVVKPETNAACAFLVPASAPAATDSGADAGTD